MCWRDGACREGLAYKPLDALTNEDETEPAPPHLDSPSKRRNNDATPMRLKWGLGPACRAPGQTGGRRCGTVAFYARLQ
jgi:hypothetical protein